MRQYFFGRWIENSEPLSVEQAQELCTQAEKIRSDFSQYPLDKVLEILDKMKRLWENPEYPNKKIVLNTLPARTGFSKEMIELGLNELSFIFDTNYLNKKLKTELRGVFRDFTTGFDPEMKRAISYEPLGVLLHVLSGNVFLVAAGSLVEGLLTGNVNILKMSSSETVFLPLLIESMIECDHDRVVSNSVAAVYYDSKQTRVIEIFKNKVDGIVIWGGEEAVRTYREKVPARTRLIVYGPKLSVALVSDRGLKNDGLVNLAKKCAEEISIWDQNACTAPQICYVEGQQNAKLFLDELEIALDKVKIPPGPVPLENAIEIQKLKSVFEIAEFKGQGALREAKCGLDWTLLLDYQISLEPSPLHRTLRIVPVDSFDTVFEEFKKVRGYLQTVGLGVGELEEFSLAGSLKDCGALRIVPLGEMAKGEIDDPHDGAYDLSLLVNFVFHKMTLDFDPLDVLSDKAREKLIGARLRVLIREARKSSYYGKILKDLCIEGLLDLEKIPVLKRLDLENNMPPASEGLKTGDTSGGYVTRSGGTTGVPKFSYYDDHDWKEMITHARRALVAGGLSKKDRVANFMIAGDLYGSFISFDHVLTQIGVMQFPFSGKITAQLFIKVAQDFKINTAIGIPSFIIPFLREVKQHAPDFKIEKIIYAGTPLSTIDRQWLHESLGARRVVSIIGANDGGGMAFQCEHQSEYQAGGFHHLMDEYNYVEIVDNNGNLLPTENVGKILITSLKKFAYPLIRYEIGDQGKILASKCKCGRTSRILEFLGRADEVLCIGMLNIALDDLRKVLVSIPYSELQLLATTDVRGEKLVLNLEISNEEKTKLLAKHEILSQLDIEKLVYQHIVQQLPKIRDSLETKLLRLEIKIYLPGVLKRNTTTGKLKSIIDERVF